MSIWDDFPEPEVDEKPKAKPKSKPKKKPQAKKQPQKSLVEEEPKQDAKWSKEHEEAKKATKEKPSDASSLSTEDETPEDPVDDDEGEEDPQEAPPEDSVGAHVALGTAATGQEKVDDRFIEIVQGNPFVRYAGLVDLAHRCGLISIETQILELPTEDNEGTCVVIAKVVMGGDDGFQSFTGIGDANDKNVGMPQIAKHKIRIAETRAKARALRDAVNVGMAAVEELDGGDTHGVEYYTQD